MPCTKCGLQLGPDARFCQRCGQPVAEATAAPSAPTPPAQETPEPPAPSATPEQPDAAPPPSPFDTPAHPYGAEPPTPFATPAQPYGAGQPSPYATPAQAYGAPLPPAPGTWPPPPPYGQAPPPPGPHDLGYGQPPWTQPVPPEATNKLSTAAFICGGLAVLFLPIILGPAAIICASRAKKRKETRAGAAMAVAIAGTVMGLIFGYWARQHYAFG